MSGVVIPGWSDDELLAMVLIAVVTTGSLIAAGYALQEVLCS